MALPEFSMRQLLEAGVHFGHQTHRWNPKMEPYIFCERANTHILDLSQTVPLLHQALIKVREVSASGGRILFVGTKRAASDVIATSAKRCAQYYVNHRWLGGMMTNWATISNSITRLCDLEILLAGEGTQGMTKKEVLHLSREQEKLDRTLGGIKDMNGKPDLLFVIDTNKEAIAIREARRLGIPVMAVLDTNCNPDVIDFPIPGNDDAARAVALYCELIADAVLDGLTQSQIDHGIDIGAQVVPSLDVDEVVLSDMELSVDEATAPQPESEAPSEPEPEPPLQSESDVISDPESDSTSPSDTSSYKNEMVTQSSSDEAHFVDDLSRIEGIGPTYRKKLADAGISSLHQMAALDEAGITKLDEVLSMKGKIVRGQWVEKAKALIGG